VVVWNIQTIVRLCKSPRPYDRRTEQNRSRNPNLQGKHSSCTTEAEARPSGRASHKRNLNRRGDLGVAQHRPQARRQEGRPTTGTSTVKETSDSPKQVASPTPGSPACRRGNPCGASPHGPRPGWGGTVRKGVRTPLNLYPSIDHHLYSSLAIRQSTFRPLCPTGLAAWSRMAAALSVPRMMRQSPWPILC
jgi:hypothetical protein